MRLALEQLLSSDDRFALDLVVQDGEGLFEALPSREIDVAVVGWVMAKGDGRFVLDRLREMGHPLRVVVYTGAANPRIPGEVMSLGGAAFCAKTERPQHLLDVLAAVAAGRMVFPFIDIRNLTDDGLPDLTRRERDLLEALASGGTNAQLATQFGVSINTVKFHLGNLYDKLGVRSRAQAVALFLEHNPPCRAD